MSDISMVCQWRTDCLPHPSTHTHTSCYSRIAEALEQCVPALETLILTSNNIEELVS